MRFFHVSSEFSIEEHINVSFVIVSKYFICSSSNGF